MLPLFIPADDRCRRVRCYLTELSAKRHCPYGYGYLIPDYVNELTIYLEKNRYKINTGSISMTFPAMI